MTTELDNFIGYDLHVLEDLNLNRQYAINLECEIQILNVFDKAISLFSSINDFAKQGKLKINYLNQYRQSLNGIGLTLPIKSEKGYIDPSFIPTQTNEWKNRFKKNIEKACFNISIQIEQLEFNIAFFDKVGYFESNIVAIGANGSGKTMLSNKFKTHLQENGVVISAQRVLLVPQFQTIANPRLTANKLKEYQIRDKTNKANGDFKYLQEEFEVVLTNLLAENISVGNTYRKKAINSTLIGKEIPLPRLTNLDITLNIWNSLIEHRKLSCNDGINIIVNPKHINSAYTLIQMSDGEKVLLYLIAQVLQAPDNGFIVIDEPEMYLHKTILKKLWDILEAKRKDCIFIYLTHDLDFATSRTTAKKIWIKSFAHPDKWEIEEIPTEDIPESLMMELLGSRKNILFCEGVKGSIDERIYAILFPELTITPVGSCFDVITHTKAFNKLKGINTNAFGLIDSDHHDSARLEKLKGNNIFSFKVAEVENLFLDAEFLAILATNTLKDDLDIELLKAEVINELNKKKETQASNYVSTKVNYYFTDSDVSKGNTLEKLEHNYQDFLSKISINEWYNKRLEDLNEMIVNKDYDKVLVTFNNKGVISIANKHLNISDFIDRSIKLLQINKDAVISLAKYFPEEIKSAGMKQEVNVAATSSQTLI